MSEDTPQKPSFPISKLLRYGGFAILLVMLIMSIVYQMSNPDATDEERIAATVQAGVDSGLTEVALQTGTPDPTAIQSTVDAGIDATLTAIAAESATPVPSGAEDSTEDTSSDNPLKPVIEFIGTLLAPIIGIVRGMWNFAGLGGLWVQVLCCIVPPLLIIVGIVND